MTYMKTRDLFLLLLVTYPFSIGAQVFSTPGGAVSNNGTSDLVLVNGMTELINPNGRTLMIERDDEDSWLTFHDPDNYWFSMGIDHSNGGTFTLNSGGTLGSTSQFVLTSSGQVGIGLDKPTSLLHLMSHSSRIQVQSGTASGASEVNLINDSGTAGLSIGSYGATYSQATNYARPNGASLHTTSSVAGAAGIAIAARNTSGYITFHTGGDTERMRILSNGNIGIGVANPGNFKLSVEGKIGAREVNVTNTNPWPDYVFETAYQLSSLLELEEFIRRNKHLPEIPSSQTVEKEGIDLGKMNVLLLKKVEELTLHLIEKEKQLQALEA